MPSPERRFNEAEVAAILERATTRDARGPQPASAGDGLTLAQLQDVGREVGIAPEAIAESAYLLDDAGRRATRRFLGLPLGVERVVPLPRRLTEEEWERLVVDLREVFDARGVVRQEGTLRHWSNGNLQALLEPTNDGQRLRLRTVKRSAPRTMAAGLALVGVAGAGILNAALANAMSDVDALVAISLTAAAGAVTIGVTALRLFPWARRRREQMADVAARVSTIGHAQSGASLEAGRSGDR